MKGRFPPVGILTVFRVYDTLGPGVYSLRYLYFTRIIYTYRRWNLIGNCATQGHHLVHLRREETLQREF